MNLFRIYSIKDNFMKAFKPEDRKESAYFYNLQTLFNSIKIENLYISNNHINSILVDEDALSKIQVFTKLKFGVSVDKDSFMSDVVKFDPENHIKFNIKEPSDVKKVIKNHMNQDHIQKIVKLKKDSLRESAVKKEILKSKIYNSHDKNIKDKKIVSIDFEYMNLDVFEIGVSVQENGEQKHYHYLIKENYTKKKTKPDLQFKFNFGETEIIPEIMISDIVKFHLKDSDYLLLHGHSNDYLILRKYGLDLEQEKKIKIMDTILYYKKYFSPNQGDAYTLKRMLYLFNMEPKDMHNSGNDAAFTLKLYLEMHNRNEKAMKRLTRTVA